MGQEESDQKDQTDNARSNQRLQSFAGMVRDESLGEWLARKEAKKKSKLIPSGGFGGTGLRRSTKPLKKTTLKKVSKKQKTKLSSYAAATKSFLSKEENQKCFLCGSTSNLSIHHKGKRGKNIDNEDLFISLCMIGSFMDQKYPESNHSHSGGCHGWVEGNKSLARKLDLLI